MPIQTKNIKSAFISVFSSSLWANVSLLLFLISVILTIFLRILIYEPGADGWTNLTYTIYTIIGTVIISGLGALIGLIGIITPKKIRSTIGVLFNISIIVFSFWLLDHSTPEEAQGSKKTRGFLKPPKVQTEESFHGAVWDDKSENVYFSRYYFVEKNEHFYFAEEIFYSKLNIFRYNIPNHKLSLLTSFDFDGIISPGELFYRESLLDNQLVFSDTPYIYLINVDTTERKGIKEEKGKYSSKEFLRRKDVVLIEAYEGRGRPKFRYLSPDRHSFIEISDLEIGIFHDPTGTVKIKTWKDLGWLGGIPDKHITEAVNQYQPQFYFDKYELRPPDEIEIRRQYNLSLYH